MNTGVVLAGGKGLRAWPYSVVRPKVMIPVANRPIVAYSVDAMRQVGIERIVVVAGEMSDRIANYFRNDSDVRIIAHPASRGSADSLSRALADIDADSVLVTYGDTIVEADDLRDLESLFEEKGNAVLVDPLGEESSRDWICCSLRDGRIENIVGHPRERATHRFAAFALNRELFAYVNTNSGIFTEVQVGMMPPQESYLEMSLSDWLADGRPLAGCETRGAFLDVDKPWQILEANQLVGRRLCESLEHNELADGATIHDTADIEGFVRLGKGSSIGRNVVIRGNTVVGAGTHIENGAIIDGPSIIGDGCLISNYCLVDGGAVVGNRCVINHAAELSGVIFDNVYLYHYMEFYGILGCNTDLGAATVCGTLRFDDGETSHLVQGRRELPREHANASYLGDYVRTGVNAIIMPGRKVGVYSVVGPGVVLSQDLPDRTRISVKQEYDFNEWGPHRYGW